MLIFLLIPLGTFFGLLVATFVLIAGWFAWTPLPLILRVPVAMVLVSPFGLIASGIPDEPQFAFFLAAVVVACVVTGFAADRSGTFTFCMLAVVLFCIAPLLVGVFLHPAMTDQLRPSVIGFSVVMMLNLSILCLPLRLLGYRLERLGAEGGDHAMRLASEKSVDEWIVELDREAGTSTTFADIASFVRERGVPDDTAKSVAKAVCRCLGKPSPRLAVAGTDGGLSSWLQWATTGPRREQYTMRQLMLWVAACSFLFAMLARTGIDRDALLWWFAATPAILALGAAINLLGWGWLWGRPGASRFLVIGGGCLSLGMSGLWFQRMAAVGGPISVFAPAFSVGTMLALNYWLMHLRREGFRLVRN